jgi:CelD/BcsL family acetyltransferase involved in cellulose biosynthesis
MAVSLAWPLASAQSLGAVEVLRNVEALRALVPAWEDLAAHALEPNPFYEPWTVLPALNAFSPYAELCFVAIRIDGRLAGLFPFEHNARYKRLPVSALSSWRHRHMLLGTPLVRAEYARQCMAALFQQLRVPLVVFRHIPASGAFARVLREFAQPYVLDEYRRALLTKGGAAAPRRNLKQAEKRLRKLGELEPLFLVGAPIAA